MSWRDEQLALIRARANRPQKPDQEAVIRRASAMLKRWRRQRPTDDRALGPFHLNRLFYRPSGVFTLLKGKEVELVEAAKSCPFAWDELCRLAAFYVESGETMPESWRGIVGRILRGELPRPGRPKRGRLPDPLSHKLSICLAVEALTYVDIDATCSKGSDPQEIQPGCQRVADMVPLSYETVLEIWKGRKAVWKQHPGWECLIQRLLWGDN